jgi:hypothetical protein
MFDPNSCDADLQGKSGFSGRLKPPDMVWDCDLGMVADVRDCDLGFSGLPMNRCLIGTCVSGTRCL